MNLILSYKSYFFAISMPFCDDSIRFMYCTHRFITAVPNSTNSETLRCFRPIKDFPRLLKKEKLSEEKEASEGIGFFRFFFNRKKFWSGLITTFLDLRGFLVWRSFPFSSFSCFSNILFTEKILKSHWLRKSAVLMNLSRKVIIILVLPQPTDLKFNSHFFVAYNFCVFFFVC